MKFKVLFICLAIAAMGPVAGWAAHDLMGSEAFGIFFAISWIALWVVAAIAADELLPDSGSQ